MKKIWIFFLLTIFMLSCGTKNNNSKENEDYIITIKSNLENKNLFVIYPNKNKYSSGDKVKIKIIKNNGYIVKDILVNNKSFDINNEIIIENNINFDIIYEKIDMPNYAIYTKNNEINIIKYRYNEELFLEEELWYKNNLKLKSIKYFYTNNFLTESVEIDNNENKILSNYIYNDNYDLEYKNIKINGNLSQTIHYEIEEKNIVKEILNNDEIMLYYYVNNIILKEEYYFKGKLEYVINYTYEKNSIVKKEKTDINEKIIEKVEYFYNDLEDMKFNLKVSVIGLGIVNPIYGDYKYGSRIKLYPIANSGYVFKGWEGKNSNQIENNEIFIDYNKNITAIFEKEENITKYSLNILGELKDLIIKIPSKSEYCQNEKVTLKVVETDKYKFINWSGKNSNDINFSTIIMNENKEIAGYFLEKDLIKKSKKYDVVGNLIHTAYYEYNNLGILEKIKYENINKKIEKYTEYIYYNNLILKEDNKYSNGNLISTKYYDYDNEFNIHAITTKNNKNEIISILKPNEVHNKESAVSYNNEIYIGNKLSTFDRVNIIKKTYNKDGSIILEEHYYNKNIVMDIEYFYENYKLIKKITKNKLNNEIMFIDSFEY